MKLNKNVLIGSILTIVFSTTIILSIEYQKSLLQIIFGFILFLFPVMFLSSFKSKIGSFVIGFFIIMTIYLSYKLGYNDFWIGILLSLIISVPVLIYRTNKFQPFKSSEYKKLFKNK